VFILAVVVTFVLLILPGWNTWRFYRASGALSTQEILLQRLIGTIVHLDESLSMSARMMAATGNARWERRYRSKEPRLDAATEEAIQLAAGSYVAAAKRTAAANRNLVAMENRAFELVRQGLRDEAHDLLSSDEYERNKRAYATGMDVLTAAIDERIQRNLARSERRILGAGAVTLASAGVSVLAWIGVVGLIWRHLAARARAEREREYLEAQIQHMQKLESLGILAGGIAHDFNNLLMPILGNVDLVLTDLPEEGPYRARLERLRDAGRRLAELTNQLLAYSGKGAFVARAIDFSGLIEEMTQLLSISISKKAVLQYELSDELPAVEGDASQLSQVVMNLVTNASDALVGEAGAITVRTGVMQADRAYLAETYSFGDCPEGRYVYLEVADSGCGMEAAIHRRVFDPFFSTKVTGKGLGLAVILGIVRGHRGAIRLESEPGRGTTFRVLFPCTERAAETISRKPASTEEWHSTGTVLVVDDDCDVRELSEIMLRGFGFKVLSAPDGRQGVEAFRKHADEIHVVLLDLTMPGMSGEEALRDIQEIQADQRVVLMSGYNEDFAASRFTGRIAGFLQKPFTREDLGETFRSLLQGSD
jgi:signal transduction histidine kinase